MKLYPVVVSMLVSFASFLSSYAFSEEVNVYSARKEALIKPLLDNFSEQTGIKVNLITGGADALITRMQSEGQFSPADILLTTDAGRLVRAKNSGLTQAVDLAVLTEKIPENLRDNDNHWFALTKRARPVMVDPTKIQPEEITSIFDLTDEKYKGQICIRSSSNIYNQSMVASLMIEFPQQTVEQWAKGIVANMARSPQGGDRDQIKAVAAGQCSIAIANTYYLAGMLDSNDSSEVQQAKKVSVVWTDQESFGTHINISGAAVAKFAPNKKEALALMSFMMGDESQDWYAQKNHEYPVSGDVKWSKLMSRFGEFNAQSVSLEAVGEGNAEALKLMDRAGWK